jgi:hypothetical protein
VLADLAGQFPCVAVTAATSLGLVTLERKPCACHPRPRNATAASSCVSGKPRAACDDATTRCACSRTLSALHITATHTYICAHTRAAASRGGARATHPPARCTCHRHTGCPCPMTHRLHSVRTHIPPKGAACSRCGCAAHRSDRSPNLGHASNHSPNPPAQAVRVSTVPQAVLTRAVDAQARHTHALPAGSQHVHSSAHCGC